MRVHMDCAGCESKVRSKLEKLKGVDTVEIDMNLQKVRVTGWADQKKVLKTVRRTGRRAELWELLCNPVPDSPGALINQYQINGPLAYYALQPSSHYNYYKHGYDSGEPRYYHRYPGHTTVFSHRTGATFSDENPHACCVM
ncbi:heavy metal-associated isoprenylated plant protein 28 [Rhodamnia argentea]|uniref:Heavy metal-associated isoprenylated plant protein 28 n=1 Tax=Rhodamnia argentea TaxID=178133 RepID=A0A8B8PV34_9MYRT|nr:heavy metal-associated isoprenylated plant protein 28 [Rhodamnia argentea]